MKIRNMKITDYDIEVRTADLDALKFNIEPAFDYSVQSSADYTTGQVFFARIHELGDIPDYEMAEVRLFNTIPDKMRFPQILPVIYEKMGELYENFCGAPRFGIR